MKNKVFNRSLGVLFTTTLFLNVSTTNAAVVSDNGGWSELWRHCFAKEAEAVLHELKSPDINFKDYQVVGLDYNDSWTVAANRYYIADFQHASSGHILRAHFYGNYNSQRLFDSKSRSTVKGMNCYLETNTVFAPKSDAVLKPAFKVFDKADPSKIYGRVFGTYEETNDNWAGPGI